MRRHKSRGYLVALFFLLGASLLAYTLSGTPSFSFRAHKEDKPASLSPAAALPRASGALPRREALLEEEVIPEKEALGELPRSLQGTEVDGELFVDADGHLVVGPGLRALFDYFLAASGEEPLSQIRARIVAELFERLPPGAAQEAVALLDRYLEYRERAGALFEAGEIPGDLEGRFAAIKALRRQVFGERDAEALFGAEEAEDAAALASRALTDLSLPPEEWDKKRTALEESLPEAVKLTREETTAPLRLAEAEAALRQKGASEEEIRALRVSFFGDEAAERLQALDAAREAWNKRLAAFRAARAEIQADSSLDPAAKEEAIRALLEKSFTPQEQRRVLALDRM